MTNPIYGNPPQPSAASLYGSSPTPSRSSARTAASSAWTSWHWPNVAIGAERALGELRRENQRLRERVDALEGKATNCVTRPTNGLGHCWTTVDSYRRCLRRKRPYVLACALMPDEVINEAHAGEGRH
ncbi:UNVERIFIED_ORG: hypothetical protein FHR35_001027 [Microbispora rosea subsp. rosea]